jgi:hypothetical protein
LKSDGERAGRLGVFDMPPYYFFKSMNAWMLVAREV